MTYLMGKGYPRRIAGDDNSIRVGSTQRLAVIIHYISRASDEIDLDTIRLMLIVSNRPANRSDGKPKFAPLVIINDLDRRSNKTKPYLPINHIHNFQFLIQLLLQQFRTWSANDQIRIDKHVSKMSGEELKSWAISRASGNINFKNDCVVFLATSDNHDISTCVAIRE